MPGLTGLINGADVSVMRDAMNQPLRQLRTLCGEIRPHYGDKAMQVLYSDGHVGKADYPLDPRLWHFDGRAQ